GLEMQEAPAPMAQTRLAAVPVSAKPTKKSDMSQCNTACPLYPRKRHQMRQMECPQRPIADITHLLDHFVSADEQRRRHRDMLSCPLRTSRSIPRSSLARR